MREWNVYRSTRQTCVERTDVIVCGRRSSDMKLAKAIDTTTKPTLLTLTLTLLLTVILILINSNSVPNPN